MDLRCLKILVHSSWECVDKCLRKKLLDGLCIEKKDLEGKTDISCKDEFFFQSFGGNQLQWKIDPTHFYSMNI